MPASAGTRPSGLSQLALAVSVQMTNDAGKPQNSADNPRAVFYCGDTPLATVSASGCRFANVTEEAPDEVSSLDMTSQTRFEFYSGGELTAVLDATGLTTAQVIEGIP